MAKLIECKDCGHKLSKKADKCPNCGAPKKKQSGCALLLAIVIGVTVIAMISIPFMDSSDSSGSGSTSAPPKNVTTPKSSPKAEKPLAKTAKKPTPEPKKQDSLVDLPSELVKPEEPDWILRTIYWERFFDSKAKNAVVGQQVEVELTHGPKRTGKLVSINEQSVTIEQGNVELELNRNQLSARTQQRLWTQDYRSTFAEMKVNKERLQYGAQLAAAYDRLLGKIDAIAEPIRKAVGEQPMTALSGKVMQVIENDVLLDRRGYDEPVYVEGIGSGLVDGSPWEGQVFFVGAVEYSTVLGAAKKVRKYSAYPPPQMMDLIAKQLYVETQIGNLKWERNTAVEPYGVTDKW